jgi:hypothetical protein
MVSSPRRGLVWAYFFVEVFKIVWFDRVAMKNVEFKTVDFLSLSLPARRFGFERHIKTLNQRIMTIHRLPIAIEHPLANWPLGDFRMN